MAVIITEEYRKVAEKFRQTFGYGVPLEQIPAVETTEGILEKIQTCFEVGEDLLPELYGFVNDPSIIY